MKRRMTPGMRNLAVWIVAAIVLAGIWLLAARSSLHFINPTSFLLIIAAAAAALTALLWWDTAAGADDAGTDDIGADDSAPGSVAPAPTGQPGPGSQPGPHSNGE